MCLNKIGFAEVIPIILEQLEQGGTASFGIHGTSMLPLLRDGSSEVRIANAEEFKKYDIIFYRRENGDFILHRIIGKKDGQFVCRGDNQTEKEFPVCRENIIGKVISYKKKNKWKKINCIRQKLYAGIWVNFPILCRIRWKLESKKKDG